MITPAVGRLLFAGAISLAGCYPTYAPAIRGPTPGAPGRIGEGEGEVRTALAAYGDAFPAGGLELSFGTKDWLAVEFGGEYGPPWAMGFAGLRFTPLMSKVADGRVFADLEVGGGMGVGGSQCGNSGGTSHICTWDGLGWSDRFAGGGYLGFGIGAGSEVFSSYLRGRVQISSATGIPPTLWFNGMFGIQVLLANRVGIYGGVGVGGYWNEIDATNIFLLLELGIAVKFDYSSERVVTASTPVPSVSIVEKPVPPPQEPQLTNEARPEALQLDQGPVTVAVLDVVDRDGKISADLLDDLSRYYFARISESQPVSLPTGGVQGIRFLRVKNTGCIGETCPIDWGSSPGARKVLRTVIARKGASCSVEATLFDLDPNAGATALSGITTCAYLNLLESLREIAGRLAGPSAR